MYVFLLERRIGEKLAETKGCSIKKVKNSLASSKMGNAQGLSRKQSVKSGLTLHYLQTRNA